MGWRVIALPRRQHTWKNWNGWLTCVPRIQKTNVNSLHKRFLRRTSRSRFESMTYWLMIAFPRLDYDELFLCYVFSVWLSMRRNILSCLIYLFIVSIDKSLCDRSFCPYSFRQVMIFLCLLLVIKMESLMNTYPVNILKGTHARPNRCIIPSSDIPLLWWIFMTMSEGSIVTASPNWALFSLWWSFKGNLRPSVNNVRNRLTFISTSTLASLLRMTMTRSMFFRRRAMLVFGMTMPSRSEKRAWPSKTELKKLPRLLRFHGLNRCHLPVD